MEPRRPESRAPIVQVLARTAVFAGSSARATVDACTRAAHGCTGDGTWQRVAGQPGIDLLPPEGELGILRVAVSRRAGERIGAHRFHAERGEHARGLEVEIRSEE